MTTNPNEPELEPELVLGRQPKKELSSEKQKEIVSVLRWELKDATVKGKFLTGVLSTVANSFHVHASTIRRIWFRTLSNFQDPDIRAF